MRSAAKTLSYGIMHMGVAFTVAYSVTGDVALAAGLSLIEPLVQTLCYSLHEWAWRSSQTTKAQPLHWPPQEVI